MERMAGFHVDKYVVMPNHIHMILSVDNGPPRLSSMEEIVMIWPCSGSNMMRSLQSTLFPFENSLWLWIFVTR